jgi:predicted Zn-dependent peptidase
MESFTLKNNIRVIFSKTEGVKVVNVRVLTPVSVINEASSIAGISYLTAKLMIRSTKNRPSAILANDVANIGSCLYGDAYYDMAVISMNFISEYFDKAIEILADIILNPVFEKKDISLEKEDIAAEFNSRKDEVDIIAYDKFARLFYCGSPYSLPVLGTKKTVAKITRESLMKWHKYSYNSSNILVSVSGNINRKTVKKSLEKYFGFIPDDVKFEKSDDVKFEKPIFDIKLLKSVKKEIKGKFNQAYIYMGFPAPAVGCDNYATVKVISDILGGRMTGKLFVELREKLGLAYVVNSIYPTRKKESHLAIYMSLDKKNIKLAIKKIDEILKDFCTKKISDQELENTKTYIKGTYVRNKQTVARQALYYGWLEIIGLHYEYETRYLEDLEKVTTEDIINIANKIFLSHFVTVVVNPNGK